MAPGQTISRHEFVYGEWQYEEGPNTSRQCLGAANTLFACYRSWCAQYVAISSLAKRQKQFQIIVSTLTTGQVSSWFERNEYKLIQTRIEKTCWALFHRAKQQFRPRIQTLRQHFKVNRRCGGGGGGVT